MSGFSHGNVYRFRCEGHNRWERQCWLLARFESHVGGEAAVTFSGEIWTPWSQKELRVFHKQDTSLSDLPDHRVTTVTGETVMTLDLVQPRGPRSGHYTQNAESWLLRSIINSLANQRSHDGNLVWDVFWRTQVRKRKPWLQFADEWWRLVDPKRDNAARAG